MGVKETGSRVATGVVVVIVGALVLGQLLGQPILLGYVTTGSMDPALEPGDGFVAIPPELAGDIEEGDVVTFEAEHIQDGELTTHRVVEETDEGYVTRGDANPFTDQDDGEPYVRESDVKAVAWQPGGSVLHIPWMGTVVMALQGGIEWLQLQLADAFGTDALLGTTGIAYLLFGLSLLLYLLSVWLEPARRRERRPERSVGTNTRTIVLAFTIVVIVGLTAAMVVPADTQEYGIVSAEFESDNPDVIERGTQEAHTQAVENPGVFPTVVIFDDSDDRVDVEPTTIALSSRDGENATVTLSAPEETGHYRADLQQYRYIGILPTSTIESLHSVHPWLPIAVINALVAIPFYVFGKRLLGSGRVRIRTRRRRTRLT